MMTRRSWFASIIPAIAALFMPRGKVKPLWVPGVADYIYLGGNAWQMIYEDGRRGKVIQL